LEVLDGMGNSQQRRQLTPAQFMAAVSMFCLSHLKKQLRLPALLIGCSCRFCGYLQIVTDKHRQSYRYLM